MSEVTQRRLQRPWLFAIHVVLAGACIAILCQSGHRAPVELAMCWTAAWTNFFVSAGRHVKRQNAENALGPQARKPLGWLNAFLLIALSLWIFGWAIFAGIAWGILGGFLLLYVELVTARVTILVAEVADDWLDRRRAGDRGL